MNKMYKVLALDPGETTGWFCKDIGYDVDTGSTCLIAFDSMRGGTVGKNHVDVWELLEEIKPDIVVIESFNLYPGKAKSMSWNSFYPCEVIGVIKLWCMLQGDKVIQVLQAPSVKKYAGGLQSDWVYFQKHFLDERVTEHVKDAYMHIKYFERNNLKRTIKKGL